MDYDVTRAVLTELEREGVRYAVFGAVALNLHGIPRATEDLDIFIAPDRENVAALKRALTSVFHDPEIEQITADDLLGDYPAIQYAPPTGRFWIDVLTRLGELYSYANLETERLDFDGLMISVVTPRMLYTMKKGTVRPKDWGDAERIARRFKLGEP